MPIVSYQHSLSSPGYAPDMAHGALPPTVWTEGANVRFERGAPRTIEGSAAAYTATTTVIHALNVYNTTSNFWVLATLTHLYATDGSALAEITRASKTATTSGTALPYTATAAHNWTSTAFGNFAVLNNGVQPPQFWALVAGDRAQQISNWPATWVSAGSVRAYRNYLVAMDITMAGDRYPSLVAWSDASPYDATTLPAWTPTTTNDAGDNNLNDTPGFCIDGLQLGGSFIVYKEDAVWAMTYVAGQTVMAFRKLFEGVGLLAKRCVQEFNGKHFFVARGDVYVTDGVNLQSVASNRVREQLFSSINATAYSRTFTAIDRSRREIWICYPVVDGYPTQALVWNYETDTWYPPRTLSPTAHLAPGIINTSTAGVAFDADSGTTFDADTGVFDLRNYNPSVLDMLACRPVESLTYRMNRGTTEGGAAITSMLSRKLLPFDGRDVSGQPTLWGPEMKVIRRLWLEATGTGTVRVYLGVHAQESSAPAWFGPYQIDLASQNFVWTLLRGRYFSIKIESDSSAASWALTGYKIEFENVGAF